MDNMKLTQFYDDLKNKLDQPDVSAQAPIRVSGNPINGVSQTPGAIAWRRKALGECDRLKNDCRKHILLDIYCKILPLDDDYVCGHHGQMKGDIDSMLATKGMDATKYLTSCYEATHAPLVEFILRSTDMIGRQFMEDADETLKDAQKNDIAVPPPEADIDSKEVEDQLVDVKSDSEYETFIDKLKEKTVNKIVNDVSKIINSKKEEKDMTFDPKPDAAPAGDDVPAMESTVMAGLNYLEKKLMKENVSVDPETQEDMIGMAIREATLNQIDLVFRQPNSDFRSYSSRMNFGKGYVINEAAANYITENAKH